MTDATDQHEWTNIEVYPVPCHDCASRTCCSGPQARHCEKVRLERWTYSGDFLRRHAPLRLQAVERAVVGALWCASCRATETDDAYDPGDECPWCQGPLVALVPLPVAVQQCEACLIDSRYVPHRVQSGQERDKDL